ncbi:MAG: LPXTG cell wall anchor domain-containing protein [Christensenellales bacterium]
MRKSKTMRMGLAMMLALVLILAMVPAVAMADEPWPAAVDGVITLEAGKTYGAYPGTIEISEGVTIRGNGASILSDISIKTDEPVIIRNVNIQPNLVDASDNGTTTYSRKSGINITGAGNSTSGYDFIVTITGCVFGNENDPKPPYRSISMPENAAPQRGSLTIRNCTFNEAIYNINLLRVENITLTNNTFNTNRSAVQYFVNASNKNAINITGNTFNGTGIGLLATISAGTFDGPEGNIGNIENNTFSGTRAVVSIHDTNVETLTIPSSSGLTEDSVHFSSYSANPKFKPEATGPLDPGLEGLLVISPEPVLPGIVTATATEFYMIDTDAPVITSVKATPYGAGGAILEVTAVDASAPLTYQWQVAGSWINISGATTALYDYKGLLPNTEYTVRVIVTDNLGNSATSQPVTFTTGAQGASELPQIVIPQGGGSTIPQTGYSISALSYLLAGMSALCGMGALAAGKKRDKDA